MQQRKAGEKIISALAEFDYLTALQITRLLYAPTSLTHVQEQMKSLADASLVIMLGGKALGLPRIYTLSGTGRQYAAGLGALPRQRFRPSEEKNKARNPYVLKHTIAITDVLIGARLLSERVPPIRLTRMYTERELKRKISVQIPEPVGEGETRLRTRYLEPDASLLFRISEIWHDPPQTWEDFFHIEVYRNLPPAEWRFKQKIRGYEAAAATGIHEALFATPAMEVAVFAQTPTMAATLKRWTEEALQDMHQPNHGGRFFFCSLDASSASPEELFLSPVWEQAFGTTTTPLLVLE
jgi:hypothetical protein